MKNRNRYAAYLFTTSMIFLLAACSGSKQEEASMQDTTQVADTSSKQKREFTEFEFDKMMANFPKPMEIESEILKSGIKFEKVALNDLANASNYQTDAKKAINFGIYSVDLGYLAVYNKKQEAIRYLKTAREFAIALHAGEAFEREAGANIEANISNKDTLVKIADDVYYDSYSHIKSSNNLEIATLVVIGSWVESQYHALNSIREVPRDKKTDAVFNKIYENQLHLSNLMNVVYQFKGKPEFDALIPDMENLLVLYKSYKETSQLQQDGAKKLYESVAAIRAKLIS